MIPSKQTGDSETQPVSDAVSDAEGHSTNREEFLALRDQNRIKSQHSNQMNETAISCRRGHCCQIHLEIQTAASGQRVLQAQANERILNRWGVLQKASERISAHSNIAAHVRLPDSKDAFIVHRLPAIDLSSAH